MMGMPTAWIFTNQNGLHSIPRDSRHDTKASGDKSNFDPCKNNKQDSRTHGTGSCILTNIFFQKQRCDSEVRLTSSSRLSLSSFLYLQWRWSSYRAHSKRNPTVLSNFKIMVSEVHYADIGAPVLVLDVKVA